MIPHGESHLPLGANVTGKVRSGEIKTGPAWGGMTSFTNQTQGDYRIQQFYFSTDIRRTDSQVSSICRPTFMSALLTVPKRQKLPKCPSYGGQIEVVQTHSEILRDFEKKGNSDICNKRDSSGRHGPREIQWSQEDKRVMIPCI